MAQANIKAVITAEDRASSTIGGVGTSFTKMAGAVAVGQLAVTAFTSAASKLLDAGKFAIQSASDFEQNRIAFETMLGSADKAKKLLKDVSDFAAKTPFELPEVVTGAKQLLAYNIEAEKLIPTFNALGNIAAGVGKDKLPQLILAFGQVKAAGRLTGNELRQFTEAGVPMLDELGKRFGKTAGEVKIMVEEGKVGFADVEAAMFGMSQEGGKFFNLMQRQSTTFGGVMSNLSDNFGKLAREIIGINDVGDIRQGSIFYYLSQGAQRFLTWLDANKDGIIKFFNDTFTNAVNFLREAWEKLEPEFQGLWTLIQTQLIPVLKDLWKELEPYAPYLGVAFVAAITVLIAALALLVVGLTIIGMTITATIKIIESIGKAFYDAGTAVGNVIADWITKIAMFYMRNKIIIDSIIGAFWAFVGALGFVGNAIFDAITQPFVRAFRFVAALMGAGLPGVGSIINRAMIPGRAVGGPVSSGSPYIVGEKGPELFVPSGNGRIVPNDQMGSASNTTININVGMMTGSATEQREAAMRIFENLQDIANTKGRTVAQMIGA